MPPKELPGFYYDEDKNRYFPIRGPIPGAAARRPASLPTPPPDEAEATASCRTRARRSKLLHARELYGGGVMLSDNNSSRSTFTQQWQYAQAAQPMAWKYQDTAFMADTAIVELCGVFQTPSGLIESKMLVTGSTNGALKVFGIGDVLNDFEYGLEFLPQAAWIPLGKQEKADNSDVASIWSSSSLVYFPSTITCIKTLQDNSSDGNGANTHLPIQRALVSTLGSGEFGGSICILDLSERTPEPMVLPERVEEVASFDHTVWTADCNLDGTQAVVGTSNGAALLNLETRALSWLYRSKSDILSQQFVHSGNVVLCGLRNGSIVPVDVRQRHRNIPTGPASRSASTRTDSMLSTRHNGRQRSQAYKSKSSGAISMSSSVCSLVALSSDEHYFLGSSMDGLIKLFDLRLIQKGAIQSYAGHVNSHTHLPIVVDPSETLVMSGGEDCTLRIWSIKTGEQIFAQSVPDDLFTALCWPESSLRFNGLAPLYQSHSWGAWMGCRDGLFYIHNS